MNNQSNYFSGDTYAQMHAQQAIGLIEKWITERYPKLSEPTRVRLITQCLIEITREKNRALLN